MFQLNLSQQVHHLGQLGNQLTLVCRLLESVLLTYVWISTLPFFHRFFLADLGDGFCFMCSVYLFACLPVQFQKWKPPPLRKGDCQTISHQDKKIGWPITGETILSAIMASWWWSREALLCLSQKALTCLPPG